jgi:hypothetical protein
MITKTVFSTTIKENVIVFDLKFPFEIVVQPYAQNNDFLDRVK